MGTLTSISWTDHTFNPWIGCTKVGPACDGCYAEALFGDTGRFPRVTWGRPGHRATHARTAASTWAEPKRWNRMAERDGVRRFVFCASVADVFDNQVPVEWRRELFDLIRATPNLTWLLLTKRPQNIERLYYEAMMDPPDGGSGYPWPENAAIGCTVVTQAEADRDVPILLMAKAELKPAFAFVSMEPLLEAVDLTSLSTLKFRGAEVLNSLTGVLSGMFGDYCSTRIPPLDWVITGGETEQGEHKARPSNPQWFRDLRDQCAAAGVAFHHKQNGEWASVSEVEGAGVHFTFPDHRTVRKVGVGPAGRTIDGVTYDARPEVRL